VAGDRTPLEVLPGGSQAAPEQPASAPASASLPDSAPRRRGRSWVLALLLAAVLVALGLQSRRAATLSADVAALDAEIGRLGAELAESHSALEAHRSHLVEVRAAVDRLLELVSSAPETPGGSAAPAPGEASPGKLP